RPRGRRALAGEPVRLSRYRPVPGPSSDAPAHCRGGGGHPLPQPVRLHRRAHHPRGGGARAHHAHGGPVRRVPAVVRRHPPRHRLVQADALAWLEADRAQYDLVFCDPPTFSNSKRAGDFDVQAAHVRLLRAAVMRLAPGGVLYFSNNFRRFRLDEAAVAEFAAVEEVTASTIPPDFERNARIHRSWRITARPAP